MNYNLEENSKSYDMHAKDWDLRMRENLSYLYLEKPAMQKLIPCDLAHKSVLDIGIGTGDELAEIIKQNPMRIVAIDSSEEMLKIAKGKFPSLEAVKMDMMNLVFEGETFDFVYSSLTFHYANDWDVLLAGVSRVLKKGGLLLFSTHNPSHWGKKTPTGKTATNSRGITLTEHKAILHAGVEVTYYNHPDADSISESTSHAGFEIINFSFPGVVKPLFLYPNEKRKYESLKENNSDPLFLVVLARKLT